MGAETELLWPGAALLLLLGAVAGLCVRCSRPGAKRTEKIYEQKNLRGSQQSFSVAARTYSSVGQAWLGPQMDTAPDAAPTGKDKLLRFSTLLEESASSRYQNFSKGSRPESDAYIDPIAVDYYNWGCSRKPPEDEDDTNSYENVLICQPRVRHTELGGEDSEDYQNSASIHQWHESTRAWEPAPRAPGSPVEDDGEPDYVNGDVAAREA
ncbi:PREDICTED: linker for activation of T-cells family member 2 [Chinchilla lanigera]|uniref:linker for activation of T-cells family member 2 n=1 Tax=Chinchilla lanigera TaxID=34839 RepID=UPI000696F0C1|nr:PREDICTED: linker for activation of T-cells family member 2 [Chinchilla lanigera]XP_013376077.1 PREDICTED: linker for activation of T-cells family member 2 [Chinchilla lanigera]XP_013376078.1 PREDICTED: linker for activation of T-cells family member 2 [Chinchilla lanigera]